MFKALFCFGHKFCPYVPQELAFSIVLLTAALWICHFSDTVTIEALYDFEAPEDDLAFETGDRMRVWLLDW